MIFDIFVEERGLPENSKIENMWEIWGGSIFLGGLFGNIFPSAVEKYVPPKI